MRKILILMWLACFVFACQNKNTQAEAQSNAGLEPLDENLLLPKNREDLITIKNGQYIEYYPDKKHVKFKGYVNEDKQRDGKWIFFGMDGAELSVGFYKNGKKDGHVVVKFPNGKLRYVGEYSMDKKVGTWELYDEQGNKTIKKYD